MRLELFGLQLMLSMRGLFSFAHFLDRTRRWQRAFTCRGRGFPVAVTRASWGQKVILERWREFFSDPCQWWDHRYGKMDVKYPDFTHKKTRAPLWLNGRSNPPWVDGQLAAMAPGAVDPSPFSWNTKLTNCAKNGEDEKTLELFQQMQLEGVNPDTFTFVQVLNACASLRTLELGKRIHGQILDSGYELDSFVGSSLIDMYAKCGCIDDARQIFNRMPTRNVVVWNAMIQGYGKCGQALEALELSHQMQAEAVEPDSVTFVGILDACASANALGEGRHIHAQISRTRFESDVKVGISLVGMYTRFGMVEDARKVFNKMGKRNVVVWNGMILAYVRWGYGQIALELFDQMQIENEVEPDSVTFVGALNACASVAALEEGRRVHALATEKGYESNVYVGNALIDMYCKCGMINNSLLVFNRMATRNVISWTAMLGGFAMHGYAKESLLLFERMCEDRVEVDDITLICLISACSHAGLVDEGIHYFRSMSPIYSVSPRTEHYVCIVDLLGRAGRLHEAEDVIKTMSCKPDVNVWKALLGACRVHGNLQMGEGIAKRVVQLDPRHASGYVLLANIYAAAGKWYNSVSVKEGEMGQKPPLVQLDHNESRPWIRCG